MPGYPHLVSTGKPPKPDFSGFRRVGIEKQLRIDGIGVVPSTAGNKAPGIGHEEDAAVMTLTKGPYSTDTAHEAVARAFRAEGLLVEHVEVRAIPGKPGAFRWWLREGAPSIVDAEVTAFDIHEHRGVLTPTNPHHPAITNGVVVEIDQGRLVVTGDESEADQIEMALRHALDLEVMREANHGRR